MEILPVCWRVKEFLDEFKWLGEIYFSDKLVRTVQKLFV
jgi:hypothetical protein